MASPTSTDAINRLLANPRLTPRERARLREQAIASGIKHTSLHLGAVTPEVEAQLKASERQNKFFDKKVQIRKGTNLAISSEGRGIGNTSGALGQARSKAIAQRTFAVQQAYTKEKGAQVREVFKSPEFKQLKESGTKGGQVSTFTEFQTLLNKKGVSAPTYERAILNELAQQDIQGKQSTEQNIARIFERQGLPATNVTLQTTDSGIKLVGGGVNDYTQSILDSINTNLSGGSQVPQIDKGLGDIIPIYPFESPEGSDAQGGFLNSIMGLLSNPLILIPVVALVGYFIFAKGGKLK